MRGHSVAIYDLIVAGWLLRRLYRVIADGLAATSAPDAAILDVGTGPGRLMVQLAQRRPDLHLAGVDPSEDMIRRARRHADTAAADDRVDFRVAGTETLPFPDDTFDVVVSTLSAHHWADPAIAVPEQARVLRPGGELRIYDLRREGLADLAPLMTSALASQVFKDREPLGGMLGARIGLLTGVKPVIADLE